MEIYHGEPLLVSCLSLPNSHLLVLLIPRKGDSCGKHDGTRGGIAMENAEHIYTVPRR